MTKVIHKIKEELNSHPYSYTSKKNEAKNAAQENTIYVIEVLGEKSKRSYRLEYMYVSTKYEKNPKYTKDSKVLEERFKFINSSPFVYSKPVIGCYFDDPVLISSSKLDGWLRELERSGMARIPEDLIEDLENIIKDTSNMAKSF